MLNELIYYLRCEGPDLYWPTQLNRVKKFPLQCVLAGRASRRYKTPCYKSTKPQVKGTCLV